MSTIGRSSPGRRPDVQRIYGIEERGPIPEPNGSSRSEPLGQGRSRSIFDSCQRVSSHSFEFDTGKLVEEACFKPCGGRVVSFDSCQNCPGSRTRSSAKQFGKGRPTSMTYRHSAHPQVTRRRGFVLMPSLYRCHAIPLLSPGGLIDINHFPVDRNNESVRVTEERPLTQATVNDAPYEASPIPSGPAFPRLDICG